MKTNSNLVTLLAGVAIGAVAILGIAAVQPTETLSCGRFQLLAADNFLFKIDTATGQIWHTFAGSPSREFMRPNVTLSGAPLTNSTPNLEKNSQK